MSQTENFTDYNKIINGRSRVKIFLGTAGIITGDQRVSLAEGTNRPYENAHAVVEKNADFSANITHPP